MSEPLTLRSDPPQQRDLTARTLTLRAESVNLEERSVEAVLATENPVPVYDMRSYEIIDEVLLMRGHKPPSQMPMLESHMRFSLDSVLGSIREIRVEGDKLIGRLYFAEDDELAQRAWNKVKQGHVTDVSVGYRTNNYIDIPAGKTQRVSGRDFTAGQRTLRVATDWTEREGSLTPIGADAASKIREEHGRPPTTNATEGNQVNDKLRKHLESLGLRSDATLAQAWDFHRKLEGNQRSEADQLLGNDQPPVEPPMTFERALCISLTDPNTPEDDRAQIRQMLARGDHKPLDNTQVAEIEERARRQERERCENIRAVGAELNIDDDLIQRAIDKSWGESEYNREFLDAVRKRRGEGAGADNRAPAGHSQRQADAETLGAALMLRSGMALDNPTFNNPHAQTALRANSATAFLGRELNDDRRQQAMDMAHRFSDRSMMDILTECIRIDGHQVPTSSRQAVMDLAFRSGMTGGSLGNVFSTSVHAQLIATYNEAGDTTRSWTRETDVMNFQQQERARLTKGPGFTKHPRGGKAEHTSRNDTAETYKIARYSQQAAVDEQDWIDDRLNALMDFPVEMGLAARRVRPDLFYYMLLANPTMADTFGVFDETEHANDGTGAALADATLRAAITAMGIQTENDVNLGLMANRIIAPVTLKFTALQLIRSMEIRNVGDGTSGDNAQFGTYNPLAHEGLQPVFDSRLDNGVTDPDTGVTASGDTDNWFLADARFPAFEVAYLAGTGRAPQTTTWINRGERGEWLMGWAAKIDIGGAPIRYQSILRRQG